MRLGDLLIILVLFSGLAIGYMYNHEQTRAHIAERYGCDTEINPYPNFELDPPAMMYMTYNCPADGTQETVKELQQVVSASSYTTFAAFISLLGVNLLLLNILFDVKNDLSNMEEHLRGEALE